MRGSVLPASPATVRQGRCVFAALVHLRSFRRQPCPYGACVGEFKEGEGVSIVNNFPISNLYVFRIVNNEGLIRNFTWTLPMLLLATVGTIICSI
jgi:hypothetical protein